MASVDDLSTAGALDGPWDAVHEAILAAYEAEHAQPRADLHERSQRDAHFYG